MNGATTEPCASTSRPPMTTVTMMIGSSQYLRRAPRNRHIWIAKSISSSRSVELESVLVVLLQGRVLPVLVQQAVAHGQRLDLGGHDAAERVFRAADDRLAAHWEVGVDQHRASGQLLELGNEPVIPRVGVAVHGLHAR